MTWNQHLPYKCYCISLTSTFATYENGGKIYEDVSLIFHLALGCSINEMVPADRTAWNIAFWYQPT